MTELDRAPREHSSTYSRHGTIGTRRGDDDVYRPVDDAVYSMVFDTAVNGRSAEAWRRVLKGLAAPTP